MLRPRNVAYVTQPLTSNNEWYMKPFYLFSILICAACTNAQAVSLKQSLGLIAEKSSPVYAASTLSNKRSFSQIKSRGLNNACYADVEHYVAEYLYQNPNTCMWKVDSRTKTVSTVSVPKVPSNAVRLPRSNGRDDTKVLENIINKNRGKALVGTGTYKVKGLKIKVPVDIFNMPMTPANGANTGIFVKSRDVRIFNSPIDAKNMSSFHTGYRVENGAHNFVLINSGLKNVRHTRGKDASGVNIKAANDFHIACNDFSNIINKTSDRKKTARANAIWMSGSNGTTSGGVIANNTSRELQSNGARKDAEFFTIQSYKRTDASKPVRVYANRGVNAGKRLAKLQESNALVLSNDYEWRDKRGPLGDRLLFAMINVQFSSNVIARNNRLTVGADGRFDYIFHTNAKSSGTIQNNIRFDCNDIEIQDQLKRSSRNVSHIFAARNDKLRSSVTGKEARSSSAVNNVVHGRGSVSFHYWFGPGYRNDGGQFKTSGNRIDVPFTNNRYKEK